MKIMTACSTRCFKRLDPELTQSAAQYNLLHSIYRSLKHCLTTLLGWLQCASLILALLFCQSLAAAEVSINSAQIDATDDGYRLSASYGFDLNRNLEDALVRGVPLYFTTDVQLTRPRWYWFDELSISASRTIRISYNVLTRQYHVSSSGQLQQSFASLDDVMAMLRRPPRWVVADKNALKSDETYNVTLRMRLDVTQLPKPFQINALNNRDWRLSSDWKEFTFKAE